MQTEDMDDWRWWRQVLVRGSGFPANGVLRLANEGLARKAGSLVNAGRRSGSGRTFPEGVGKAGAEPATARPSSASPGGFLPAGAWQNNPPLGPPLRPS